MIAAQSVHNVSTAWGLTTEVIVVALSLVFLWVLWILLRQLFASRRR